MYVSTEYWHKLTPPARSLHIARTLQRQHPTWIFTGITAATIRSFDHPWLLHDGSIGILSHDQSNQPTGKSLNRIRRFYTAQPEYDIVDGLRTASAARTLVDCALTCEFRFSLAMFDSALRQGVAPEEVERECARLHRDCAPVFRLLRYADPARENGGESLSYATVVDARLMLPQVQVEIVDPTTGRMYRVDFLWRLPDGRIIVGELDGAAKYVDPSMTDGRSIHGVVADEREREQALRRAGVTSIVRFTFREVVAVTPFLAKLRAAGIPHR
ncbi:hypothetical protein [Bifidobacterium samirii]|nr:hypothetical protein [Bifidobacterium samirii]